MILVVTNPFGGHEKGDRIAAPDQIAAALETHPHDVVRSEHADAPAARIADEGEVFGGEPETTETDSQEA